MRSGEILKQTGITRDTLRHYVEIGIISPTTEGQNGYKQYCEGDIELIEFIRKAQKLGFSLSEIGNLAEHMNSSVCKHKSLLPYLREQLGEIDKKISVLNGMRNHLEGLIKDFEATDCEEKPEVLRL